MKNGVVMAATALVGHDFGPRFGRQPTPPPSSRAEAFRQIRELKEQMPTATKHQRSQMSRVMRDLSRFLRQKNTSPQAVLVRQIHQHRADEAMADWRRQQERELLRKQKQLDRQARKMERQKRHEADMKAKKDHEIALSYLEVRGF